MPTLLTKAAAEDLLGDRLSLIGDCLRAGADRYNATKQHLGPVSARSQASLIHDYAAEHAEIVFTGMDDVTPRRCQELMILDFVGVLLVRFRKLADGWQFSRNETIQTARWERQEPLEGMPSVTNLVAGYRLDAEGREIDRVALVCTLEKRYQWHIDIPAPGQIIPITPELGDDAPAAARAIVRSEQAQTDAETETTEA